jgi:hypothetical protein
MKIARSKLIEIIESEVRAALAERGAPKKSKKPSTAAADEEPGDLDPAGDPDVNGGGIEPIASAPPIDGGMNDAEDEEDGGDEEARAEKDADDAVDADGDGGENPSGAVNDEVSGKTVQAVTIEPESEVLKGAAKEVVITFNETTDPLRIIVTPTGEVKFFWRGQLHDIP